MANLFTGQIYEISPDLGEPLVIDSFDITKDAIQLAGRLRDYTLETVDGNLKISNTEGEEVATVTGVTDLEKFTGSTPDGSTYLVSIKNEFFSTYAEANFYAPIYPIQNPDVDALIEAGEYTSYYDHFLNAGQFELREDTFFVGTEGNDTLYALGYETVLVGVPISDAIYRPAIDVVPLSTGEGEIDILYGGNSFEAIYVLGSSNLLNQTPQTFYLGQGDNDYALIKDFSRNDVIRLGEDPSKFTQEIVDGNLRISKDGDLVAIVENTDLLVAGGNDGALLFNAPKFKQGTAGNDTLNLRGNRNAIGAFLVNENYQLLATSAGVGEVDTFKLTEDAAFNSIYLGYITKDSPDTPQSFYLGNGDADYALVKEFTASGDTSPAIILAGKYNDYEIEVVDNDTRISKDGDLVGIVEGNILVPDFEDGGYTYLYSSGDPFYLEVFQSSFNETIYLENNPDAAEAVAADVYSSGLEHFLQVGLLEERTAYYNGTGESDAEVLSLGNSYVIGVAATGFDAATEQFTTETTGTGEVDGLFGSLLTNKFVLGSNGESFYLGSGDEDYATVNSFDPLKDYISLAGNYTDYTFETVEGSLNISKDGDLVAIVDGVAELKQFTGSTPDDTTYLLSLENEFFSTYAEANFYAPIYPIQNPDVDALIEAGEYTSYYDHFLNAGQFETREDTFFIGTEGDDTLYALGYETVLVGVPISDASYGPVDVVPLSLGVGQIDTLYGGNTFEAIYVLGNGTQLNETAQSFYIGEGDADYALIKDFSPNDVIFMGSEVSGFTQEVVEGNLEISKDGDLIAVVENSGLLIGNGEFFNNFNYIQGTAGDDTLDLSGTANAIGVPLILNEDYQPLAETIGTGEFDTFNFLDAEATNPIYLGFPTVDSPDTPQTFYLGNGDEDYALIKNFNPLTDHNVLIPGKFEDYEFEIVDGSTRISKDDDLVALVENTILVPDFEADGYTNLYPSEDIFFVENSQPFFNENIYLENNPDVADAIAADVYTSGYQHFMRVGLLEGRYAYYNGTSGSDGDIYAMGNSYVLGVPATGFDATTEQFTTETAGTGEVDGLTGTVGVNKFVLGSNSESFYLGGGAEDYATVGSFDPLKDYIFLAGEFEDYTLETVEGSLNIAKDGDLVAIASEVESLELFEGENPEGGFYLVSEELQPKVEPPTPVFGSIGDDAIDVTSSNQLIFAGSDNDTIEATSSQGNNRIYLGTGDDTTILGSKDILTGQDGDDRFFAQTGGDNILTGGMGADQFWIAAAEIPTSANTVTDFTLGEDVIGIAGLGASFESLTLTQQDMNALIAFDGNDLAILKGIQVTDLSGDNFAFV